MEYGGYDVIYLEPDIQLNQVIERIRESPSPSLAFVVHDRSPLFYSGVNLDLIGKRLTEEGRKGVFISTHPQLVKILTQDGWTVHSSLEDLQEEYLPHEVVELVRDPGDGEEGMMPQGRRRKKTFFFLLFLLFLGFSTLFYLRATAVVIEITPTRTLSTQEMTFVGDRKASQVSLQEGLLPLQAFSFSRELVKDFPATGRQVVGTSSSRGWVSFINQSQETIFVPAGTPLQSREGVEFITLEEIRIPAAEQEYILDVLVGKQFGGGEVMVEAVKKGSSGNVAPGEIREWVQGPEGIQVINSQRFSGGADEEIPVITEEDLAQARCWMEEELAWLAAQDLQGEIGEEHLVVRDLNGESQLQMEASKRAGEQGAFFYLTGNIQAHILYLHKEDLEYLVANSFVNGLSPGYRMGDHPLQIKDLNMTGSPENGYWINLTISGEVIAVIDTRDLRSSFTGNSMDMAHQTLRTMEEVDCFRIIGRDRDRIPPFPLALKVIVEE